MRQFLVVLITVGDLEKAQEMARKLIEHRLAACVNILPNMTSIYHWEGKVCSESEVLLLVKTDRGHFAELERRVKEWHSYELPEIIALDIDTGSRSYLDWVARSMTPVEVEE